MPVVFTFSSVMGAIATVVNPVAGLLFLMGVPVVQPGELYPILDAMQVERIMTILVMGSYLLHYCTLKSPKISKVLVRSSGAMLASVPLPYSSTNSPFFTIDFGKIILCYQLIVNLVDCPTRFRGGASSHLGGLMPSNASLSRSDVCAGGSGA